jgi:hypothetical protein
VYVAPAALAAFAGGALRVAHAGIPAPEHEALALQVGSTALARIARLGPAFLG